jgi:hypothetical protein
METLTTKISRLRPSGDPFFVAVVTPATENDIHNWPIQAAKLVWQVSIHLAFQCHPEKINTGFRVKGSQNFLLDLDVKAAGQFFVEIHAGFSHFPGQNHFPVGF